jgi:hypothetical protein
MSETTDGPRLVWSYDDPATPTVPFPPVLDVPGITKPARDLIELANEAYREGYADGYDDALEELREAADEPPLRWWEWLGVAVFSALASYGVLVTGLWLWLA